MAITRLFGIDYSYNKEITELLHTLYKLGIVDRELWQSSYTYRAKIQVPGVYSTITVT